jgi:hypothetical protein
MSVIEPGTVLVIPEAHYAYGVGDLTLRVQEIADLTAWPQAEWVRIVGVEIRWDGTDGDRRTVLVRVSALPTMRRVSS